MKKNKSTIFSEVKKYLSLRNSLNDYLLKNPQDWIKFQNNFNVSLDKLYSDIVIYEKENIIKNENSIYRGKQIFQKRYRKYFVCGEFIKWSLEKPHGYAGDFKIIEDIYRNSSNTQGFDRLWDNYFQQLTISNAIRSRKDDIKKIILESIKGHNKNEIRIMNLASGPAKEVIELLDNYGHLSDVIFDCYDFDINSINYARNLLKDRKNVNFFEKNAIRLALKKEITQEIPYQYDLIYSTGLFDYLDVRVGARLVSNLKRLIKPDGLLVIANVTEKYNNPSAGWMEWVADWYLIYRTKKEFLDLFIKGGYKREKLEIKTISDNVIQYCFAR